jgi:hypothetical protein
MENKVIQMVFSSKGMSFLILLIALLLFECSCINQNTTFVRIDNDTIKVIKAALREAMSLRYMPDASSLKHGTNLTDSIILTSSVLPLSNLPSNIDSQIFKIFPEEEVCRDSASMRKLNYLNVVNFEKSDTGFYIQILNLSCIKFGGGGSLELTFKKENDSVFVVHRSASSIN